MLFDGCEKFDLLASIQNSLNSIIPDYNELNVKKICMYFNDLDFFDLAFDDVDHILRLTTRCLKPKTNPEEIEENIELLQNLGISALLKRNVEVYQTCCKGLWDIGKKYKPLVMAKDKTGLLDNFHLRLKVWTSLYRVCSYSSHKNFASGVLDCNEKDFGDGLSAVHFGSLMNIARLNEKRIPCSCVSTSWKVLIPSSFNSDFLTIYYNFFNLSSPPGNVDSALFKTAFAYILTLPKEFFITVFYYLFPAFFHDYTKAGRSLYYFYSKIPSLSSELVQILIECFSQNIPFIPHCETLLKDLTHKVNNGKDEITANYFPDEFTSISTIVKNYRLRPQHCDDKFQLFLRLYVKYLDESGKCESLVSSFESFWGQSKVAKVYSFYLVLLAATTEILGPKYVLKQVKSLSGDIICPQECLFLRFYVLQRTTSSEFQQIFKEFKPKIEASASNFPSFIKAFPTITSALHAPGTNLMFSLISKEVVQRLSVDDLAKFINQIQSFGLLTIPSFVFELFQKDMNFDLNFAANFFVARLSTSTIPVIEKCFKSNFVTMGFIEKLVETIIKQEKIFSPINVSFGYQLALLYCFTKKFMINEEDEQQFSKLLELVSRKEVTMIKETANAVKNLDTILKGRSDISFKVYSKPIFEIIDENVKKIPECMSKVCGQICEILLSESFVNTSNAFKGTANDLPFIFVLKSFFETYLINKNLPDKEFQIDLLKRIKHLRFPNILANNKIFIGKFKENLEEKIDYLEF